MPDPNAQTLILEKDIRALGDRISENVHRLDRHLEIYSQNGKELAALKSAVASLEKALDNKFVKAENEHIDIRKHNTLCDARITALEINVSKLAMKIGIYASLGSAAASSVVVFLVVKLLEL